MISSTKTGRAIRELRIKAGYTQKELADQLFISTMAVSKWETGKSLPDISIIRRLARFLSTDIEGLIDGTATYTEEPWHGMLLMRDRDFGASAETLLYDKPMIDYFISYFLLAGIRTVVVICTEADKAYIDERFDYGRRLGISITCHIGTENDLVNEIIQRQNYVMLVTKPMLIYGVDLTRFLSRGMEHRNAVVNLASVVGRYRRIGSSSEKKDALLSQYDYEATPLYFLSKPIAALEQLEDDDQVIEEPMDKGFLLFSLASEQEVARACSAVKLIQEQTGTLINCPLEIAWRRGIIGLEHLRREVRSFPEYRAYFDTI